MMENLHSQDFRLNVNVRKGDFMISWPQNKKSLTFYQRPQGTPDMSHLHGYASGATAVAISSVSYMTASTTTQYNNQLNGFLDSLNAARDRINQKVSAGLAKDPQYTGARGDGVKLAWDYEKADVEMGGKGSARWNRSQRREIRTTGRVRGAEGHHQKNVADHPAEQGNPDNVRFFESREEHLRKGHKGDYRNSSDARLIDKNKMLRTTNAKRVFANELRGVGIAAAIGAGIGFTISFAITLAQSGVTPDTVKYAVAEGGKAGISSGAQAVVGYAIGRTIGQIATCALEGTLSSMGIAVTENISKICNMGAVGALTIAVFSTYQFIKLVRSGMACRQALLQVGRQVLFSLSLLALSILVQYAFGGYAGLIFGVATTVIMVGYTLADITHQRYVAENIQIYMIEKCKPLFA